MDAQRQWPKACYGLDFDEIDRQSSFCAHAILVEQVMVISDTLLDQRFLHNPLVTGSPFIRSYIGAPLKTPEGIKLGTLCVMDTAPHEVTSEQQVLLEQMAAMAMDELELRRSTQELQRSEAALRETLRHNSQLEVTISNLTSGMVIIDPALPDNSTIFANSGFYALTGYSLIDIIGYNCRFLQGPETNPATVEEIRQASAQRRPFAGTLINYRKNGTRFVNELIVDPVFDAKGHLLNFAGLQNDVTEREEARDLLEQRVRERTADLAQSQIEILQRLACSFIFIHRYWPPLH